MSSGPTNIELEMGTGWFHGAQEGMLLCWEGSTGQPFRHPSR